ncbi:MAG TPA: sulfotransferase domain-containing protein [Chthoniobacterales bacterium]|nr:sulfotransferase domain-containing protein [Chthoniobacterales bacterium]
MITPRMFFRRPEPKLSKVDFIVAGAQKAGTTAVHYFLERHPQITLPDKQELHFFDDDERFARGVDYEALHRSFRPKRGSLIAGECTPSYVYWGPAIERIWNYRREIKLIILLRNPILRAFSHWNMQCERKFEALDFLDAIRAEPARLAAARPLQSRRFSYLDRGFYSAQLERVYHYFPRVQVHVVKYETFRDRQKETLDSIFGFLGVESIGRVAFKERNKIAYGRPITAEERHYLAEIYRDEISKVEQLLEWDCSDWAGDGRQLAAYAV